MRRPDLSLSCIDFLMQLKMPIGKSELESCLQVITAKVEAAAAISPEFDVAGIIQSDGTEVIVLAMSGQQLLSERVAATASVLDIKRALRAVSGISESRQTLSRRGEICQDSNIISDMPDGNRAVEFELVVSAEDDALVQLLKKLHAEVGWFGVDVSANGKARLNQLRDIMQVHGGKEAGASV